VIAAVGVKYGHISERLMSVLIYALGISAVISTYVIKYNISIWRLIRKLFGAGRSEESNLHLTGGETIPPVFILGFHRGARAIIDNLRETDPAFLANIRVIDYNVEVLKALSAYGIQGIFGDISSVETLKHCGIEHAKLIVSTVPDLLLKGTSNLKLARACRELNPTAVIFATAETPEQVRRLEDAGADHVVLPYSLAGQVLAGQILAISAGEFEENSQATELNGENL
jgi:voltage-gated potassium channel Kch